MRMFPCQYTSPNMTRFDNAVSGRKQSTLLDNVASVDRAAQDLNNTLTGYINEDKKWKADVFGLLQQNANGPANSEELAVKFAKAAESMREEQITENILEQLRFREMTDREEMVALAHRKTFGWIFDSRKGQQHRWTNFVDWLTGEETLYWITGKAGSGKSTLMKFILNDSRTTQYLERCADSLPLVVARFYFWNSGTTMQMSVQGLLRTLLSQVANKRKNLIPSLFPKRWHYHKRYGDDLHPWDLLELQKAFKALLQEDRKSIKLCFFIDGLDEFSGDHVGLVSMIQGFVLQSTAKFCISSRPWVCFEDAFGHGPHLLLERLTYPDIEAYVISQFRENKRFLELEKEEPEYTQRLVGEIARKAAGVFLWVLLVVRSLLEGFSNADRTYDLQRRLDALPADLEDLFSKMLDRIDPFYREHASQLFQLIRAAHEPLTLLQMSFADEEDLDFAIRAKVKPLNMKEIMRRQEVMNRRLKSRCMGLLEVPLIDDTKDVDDGSLSSPLMTGLTPLSYKVDKSRTVQYLHRTVKDYLEQPLVWKRIVSMSQRTYCPNFALLRSYLLRFKTFTRKDFHLLTEIVILAMLHARRAEIETGKALTVLLDELDKTLNIICAEQSGLLTGPDDKPSQSWILICGCIPLELQSGSNFVSFAVMADLRLYVQQKIDGVSSRLSDNEGCPLLIYALTQSLRPMPQRSWPPIDMIKILLDEGADPNEHFNLRTALSYALDAATESRSENFADPDMMGKWADVIELFLQLDAEPSPKEIRCISKFLRKLDPVRATKFERFLEEKKQNDHSHHDHETTPEVRTPAKPFLNSTIHEAAAHTKSQLQAGTGFWKRIGGKLFGL